MFIREVASQRKYGPPVKYLQLVQSKWDPKTKKSTTEILCKFGRVDRLNKQEIRSIAYKLLSYLEEEYAERPHGVAVGQTK